MSLWKDIENRIIWDFKVGDEFKKYQEGYAFVVDVYEGIPKLSLYKIKKNSAECNPIRKQPDQELLCRAIEKQGIKIIRGGIFSIDSELQDWIKENLFKD